MFDIDPVILLFPISLLVGGLIGYGLSRLVRRPAEREWRQKGRDDREDVDIDPYFRNKFTPETKWIRKAYDQGFWESGPYGAHVLEALERRRQGHSLPEGTPSEHVEYLDRAKALLLARQQFRLDRKEAAR